MKTEIRFLSILILSLLLFSCNNEKSKKEEQEAQELELVNSVLQEQNTKLEEQKNQTKFVWTIIEHKRGSYTVSSSDGKTGFKGPMKDYIIYSDVIEVNNYNEDKEYRLQDELEKDLRRQFGYSVHSIQNRETFAFDTYREASEHRYNFIN